MSDAFSFKGLALDSRKVGPGFLFAALSGAREDGARYIADAVARGAVAVLGRPELQPEAERLGVCFIADTNPRRRLAELAVALYPVQPEVIAAVTGTNGKTSVCVFLRQIWTALGYSSASVGTIGIISGHGQTPLSHTTPDAIALHQALADLAASGTDHVAIEASSHGLDQHRLDGVRISAAAFTNLTRDHLDYHGDFAHYRSAKLRLFSEVLVAGGAAVINADAEHADQFMAAAQRRMASVFSVGRNGSQLRLLSSALTAHGQSVVIEANGIHHHVALPLVGGFQLSNALLAAGLAIVTGGQIESVLAALSTLKGASGRLERVAISAAGAPIYVDYAHTPDALETVLKALRPHVSGRLSVVFGCGGDRDAGKRPLMGLAAQAHADQVIVTDDNPRSEDPARIRAQILEGCPDARTIADRAEAIAQAIADLGSDDALIIAGKGHESGQIIGDQIRPFNDREEAIKSALAWGGKGFGA